MSSRRWDWLRGRIVGLLTRPVLGYAPDGWPLWPNRLQEALAPARPKS